MKVIVNGRFLLHNVTGVERYAREILYELDKIIDSGKVEMAVPPEIEATPTYKNINVVRVGKLHNRLWEHISFPWYVKTQKAISLNLCSRVSKLKTVSSKMSGSGQNVVFEPVSFACPITCIFSTVLPLSKARAYILPSLFTSTSILVERAFTTDAPTP